MYGIPLKVAPPEMSKKEKEEVRKLGKRREALGKKLRSSEVVEKDHEKQITRELEDIKKHIGVLKKSDQGASLDSEVALVLEERYSLSRWIPNPYFLGYRGKKLQNMPRRALMVSRLDGPSDKIVKRIIDDSIVTEKTGLKGKAYFDARWSNPGDKKNVSGYALYDRSILPPFQNKENGGGSWRVKSFLLTNGPVLRKRHRKTQKTYPFHLKGLLGNFFKSKEAFL